MENKIDLTGKRILDMTCGGRSIWFNKRHPAAVYVDQRDEEFAQVFGSKGSERHFTVHPDIICDYRNLPFEDGTFDLVVFDPPHIVQNCETGWFRKRYGMFKTKEEAIESVSSGFREGMRVLKRGGCTHFQMV